MSQFHFDASANRGECRQPCRREYLIKDVRDGKEFTLGQDYVMSPKISTLCLFSIRYSLPVSTASRSRVVATSPEYVSEVTACYRRFIDFYYGQRGDQISHSSWPSLKQELMARLDAVFHRGFSDGFSLVVRLLNGPAVMAQKPRIAKCTSG